MSLKCQSICVKLYYINFRRRLHIFVLVELLLPIRLENENKCIQRNAVVNGLTGKVNNHCAENKMSTWNVQYCMIILIFSSDIIVKINRHGNQIPVRSPLHAIIITLMTLQNNRFSRPWPLLSFLFLFADFRKNLTRQHFSTFGEIF